MHFVGDLVRWFTTAAHWQGDNGIPHRVWEHVVISVTATVAAIVIVVPPTLLLGHLRRFGVLAINLSNLGRAIPSLALLVLFASTFGIGWEPTFIALLVLAMPPLVTNSYVGMAGVDDEIRESAVGMGMTPWQSLRSVELPMALPVVLAGVRTSAVQVVATATLGALVAWGGLGRYIVDGLAVRDFVQVVAGAILVGLLAILTEIFLAFVQRLTISAGLTNRHRDKNEPFVGAATAVATPVEPT